MCRPDTEKRWATPRRDNRSVSSRPKTAAVTDEDGPQVGSLVRGDCGVDELPQEMTDLLDADGQGDSVRSGQRRQVAVTWQGSYGMDSHTGETPWMVKLTGSTEAAGRAKPAANTKPVARGGPWRRLHQG